MMRKKSIRDEIAGMLHQIMYIDKTFDLDLCTDAILTAFKGIIGEEEPTSRGTHADVCIRIGRNELRKELLNRLEVGKC